MNPQTDKMLDVIAIKYGVAYNVDMPPYQFAKELLQACADEGMVFIRSGDYPLDEVADCGSKHIPIDLAEPCPDCRGSGQLPKLHFMDIGTYPCPACKGTGVKP